MENNKINEDINEKILEIWKKYGDCMNDYQPEKEELWPRCPISYDELKTEAILYVGFNPSFSETRMGDRIEKMRKEYENLGDISAKDFKWEGNVNDELKKFCMEARTDAKENYSYFSPMRDFVEKDEFSSEKKIKWEHIDLFAVRLTSQTKLKDMIKEFNDSDNEVGKKFIEEQKKIFFKLLESLEPRVIVVENAAARDLIIEKLKDDYNLKPVADNGDDLVVDEHTGYQEIKINDEWVPIFFSGMLSGQRALDKGSRLRLNWHIKKAIKNTE